MTIAFRYLALLLIVLALMLLGADIVTSLEDKSITVRSLEAVWALLAPGALAGFKHWAAGLPSPVGTALLDFLTVWAWGVLGVLGVVIAFLLGRDRHLV